MKEKNNKAAWLSFFIIGLGQIYNKNPTKGVILFILAVIVTGYVSVVSKNYQPVAGISVLMLLFLWIYNIHDAYMGSTNLIFDKLGKRGIPGFRSKKGWKMLIAVIGYYFIIIFLLASISSKVPDTDKYANSISVNSEDELLKSIRSKGTSEKDITYLRYEPDSKKVRVEFKAVDNSRSFLSWSAISVVEGIYSSKIDVKSIKIVGYVDYTDRMGNRELLEDFRADVPRDIHDRINYKNLLSETAVSNWNNVVWSKRAK